MKALFALAVMATLTLTEVASAQNLKIIAPEGVNLKTSIEARRLRPRRPFLLPFRRRLAIALGLHRLSPPKTFELNTNVQFPAPKK